MNFLGYFVKIENFKLSHKHYLNDSLSILKSERTLNSYYDGNGVFHEAVSAHVTANIKWTTPNMRETTYRELMNALKTRRNLIIEYYDAEDDVYRTSEFRAIIGATSPRKHIGNDIRVYGELNIELKQY